MLKKISLKILLYFALKYCRCSAWMSVSIHESSASCQTTTKRLKQTPGETPALRKEVKIGLFSQPKTRSPSGAFAFEDVPLCEVCSLTSRGHDLLPSSLPWPGWSCFPGQDQLLACSCGTPTLPLYTKPHNKPPAPPTFHPPSLPQHYIQAILLKFRVNMTSGSVKSFDKSFLSFHGW